MATIQAAMSGVALNLLTSTTTGTGTAIAIPSSFRNHEFLLTCATGVTAGTIQLEVGSDPTLDTATWAPLAATTLGAFTITSAVDQMIQFQGLIPYVRARVTTAVSGGAGPAATVIYTGAKSY